MRKARTMSGMSAVTVALLLAASLVLSSCATTNEVLREPPDLLELVAGLEQTREVVLEEELTFALSRIFGLENVHVIVSSRAQYGTTEEREEVSNVEAGHEKVVAHTSDMGQIQRVTVAVLINSDVLSLEQEEDIEGLREKLYHLVANGAGLIIEEGHEFGDSVAILFMPFVN